MPSTQGPATLARQGETQHDRAWKECAAAAKTTEGMKVANECFLYSKKVVGTFGLEEEKSLPATFGATIERRTDEPEEQLIAASKTDIEIGDTAVGLYEQRRMEDFVQAVPKFTNEQWAIMNAKREQHATNQGLGGDP